METIGTEFDLECNSPCDFGDIGDDESDDEPDHEQEDGPRKPENEELNEAELLFLSDAGGDMGVLIKDQLPSSWLQSEEDCRCSRACYQEAQGGVRKLLSREKGVQWILKTQKSHKLSTITASLAVSYLDRMMGKLSTQELETFRLDVLPIACLHIACKMEENFTYYTPEELQLFCPEQPVLPSALVNMMEKVILVALDWRMNAPVPAFYATQIICLLLPYSSTCCPTSEPRALKDTCCPLTGPRNFKASDPTKSWLESLKPVWKRTSHLLLVCLSDPSMLSFLPSEIALTAVKAALDPGLVSAKTLEEVTALLTTCSTRVGSCDETLQRLAASSQPMAVETSDDRIIARDDVLAVPSTPEHKLSMTRRVSAASPSVHTKFPMECLPVKNVQGWESHVLRGLNGDFSRGLKRLNVNSHFIVEGEGHVAKVARRW